MPEGPIPLPPDRLDELVSLTNRVFRSQQGDMGREYPLVFDPDRTEGMRVILEDDKVVSHVGVCVRDAFILGIPLRVASIGAVCTDPEYRGRGFADQLMNDAVDRAREWGAHLMLISGDRGLYRRQGACRPGRYDSLEISEAELPPGLAFDQAGETEIPELASLYQREPVRFQRSYEDWMRLLAAGMLMNRAADCWLVRDTEETLAYVAVQRPDSHSTGDNLPNVQEYAGSREAVWSALKALAGKYGSSSIRVTLMPEDRDLLYRARRETALIREHGFPGTLRLLDVAEVVDRMRPLWRERLGQAAMDALELQADRDSLSYVSSGDRVRLEGPEVACALFGPEQGGESTGLPEIPTLPLLWYGYNYV